jgi:hypothetical protein
MNHDPFLSAPSDFEGVNPFTEINFQVKFPRREEWTELTTLPATGDVASTLLRLLYPTGPLWMVVLELASSANLLN